MSHVMRLASYMCMEVVAPEPGHFLNAAIAHFIEHSPTWIRSRAEPQAGHGHGPRSQMPNK